MKAVRLLEYGVRAPGCGRGVEGHGRESVKTQGARQDCAASGLAFAEVQFDDRMKPYMIYVQH
jgi:hypothetical protein